MKSRTTVALCFLTAALLSLLARAEETGLDALFARTAQADGRVYATDRNLLEKQGESILPFLAEKEKSADWRERDLAKALIIRIREPEKTARLHGVLGYSCHTLTFREDGAILATVDVAKAEQTKKRFGNEENRRLFGNHGDLPPFEDVVFDKECAPIVHDFLRETFGDSLRKRGPHVLSILKHLCCAESAPTLICAHRQMWEQRQQIMDIIVGLGTPALPYLRETVKTCPLDWKYGISPPADWLAMRSSLTAAEALGRMGDTEGAVILAERLSLTTCGEQVEAFSQALSSMQFFQGLPVVFLQLVRTVEQLRDPRGRTTGNPADYPQMRAAVLGFGEKAAALLQGEASEAKPLPGRLVARGILFELRCGQEAEEFYGLYGNELLPVVSGRGMKDADEATPPYIGRLCFWNPDTTIDAAAAHVVAPHDLLMERGYVFRELPDILRIARSKNDPTAFEIAAEMLLRYGHNPEDGPKIALALAEGGNERTLEAYQQLLEPPQRATPFVSTLVEGMLLLGSAKAIPILEEIIQGSETDTSGLSKEYWQGAELARGVLPFFKGDKDALAGLLGHENPATRESAAQALGRKGDLRSLPVLVAASVQRQEDAHRAVRDTLVALGEPAVAPLKERMQSTDDWRERLLCESVGLRILSPDLVVKFNAACFAKRPAGFYSRKGPGVGNYRTAGKTLADSLGDEAVPLIEAALVFRADACDPQIGACALACFKQERSIELLLACSPLFRKEGLLAAVLPEFGEKGIEAAKKVPAPNPEKAGFVGRAGRHREAADALVKEEGAAGLEKILEGLRVPKPADTMEQYSWRQATNKYLELARKYRDPRLLEAAVGFIEGTDEALWANALTAVRDYDDPRIAALCVRLLTAAAETRAPDEALHVLVSRMGLESLGYLLETFKGSNDAKERVGIALALEKAFQHDSSMMEFRWEKGAERSAERYAEHRKALAKRIGDTMEPLSLGLQDKSAEVQTACARALVSVGGNRYKDQAISVDQPLAKWVETQKEPYYMVIDYLEKSSDPAVAPALLACYRNSAGENLRVLSALGKKAYPEAYDDIAAALEKRIAARKYEYVGIPELKALGALGEKGIERVYGAFHDCPDLAVRVGAAQVLGEFGYSRALPEISALLEELIENGLWHEGLAPRHPSQREETYAGCVGGVIAALASFEPKLGYPVLIRALMLTDNEGVRSRLAWQIERIERAEPGVKQLQVDLSTGKKRIPFVADKDLPDVPFLRALSLWGPGAGTAVNLRKNLVDAGIPALEAAFELSFHSSEPLAEEQVGAAFDALKEDATREQAIVDLALGKYSPTILDKLLASASGQSLHLGLAIRQWRRQGPWFLNDRRNRRYGIAETLAAYWPVEKLREFALANIDRLAQVEVVENVEVAQPALLFVAAIRYSPLAEERDCLLELLKKAAPGMAEGVRAVMKDGLGCCVLRMRHSSWGEMPAHDYGEAVEKKK